ncbi:MAG: response regulator [Oligoflexales bacterium]|nr:response regulator [Oligoflexales bacterium]
MGHEVLTSPSGSEGIKSLRDNKDCQLIISDYHMPDMNGLTMANLISSNEGCDSSKIPIIMLTTEECSQELMEEAKKSDVKGWMKKPVSEPVLRDIISKFVTGE